MAGDNVYRFACACGLALVVAALLGFVFAHTAALERRASFVDAVVSLEAKEPRTKAEEELLEVNRRLLQVTSSDDAVVRAVLGVAAGAGLLLVLYGWVQWQRLVRPRDERFAALQMEKLQLELSMLRAEHAERPDERLLDDVEDEG
jgi:hypothetical protein